MNPGSSSKTTFVFTSIEIKLCEVLVAPTPSMSQPTPKCHPWNIPMAPALLCTGVVAAPPQQPQTLLWDFGWRAVKRVSFCRWQPHDIWSKNITQVRTLEKSEFKWPGMTVVWIRILMVGGLLSVLWRWQPNEICFTYHPSSRKLKKSELNVLNDSSLNGIFWWLGGIYRFCGVMATPWHLFKYVTQKT